MIVRSAALELGRSRPLAGWIVAELLEHYGIPAAVAHDWLVQPRLLLLLGGLEHLSPRRRFGCLDIITAFRAHYLGPLMLITTLECYLPLSRLQLTGAVVARYRP